MPDKVELVLAAANKYDIIFPDGKEVTITVCDSGHGGKNAQGIVEAFLKAGCEVRLCKLEDRGQGFINQDGDYLTRHEAYLLASTNGQPYNPEYLLGGNTDRPRLDSSCIRHLRPEHMLRKQRG